MLNNCFPRMLETYCAGPTFTLTADLTTTTIVDIIDDLFDEFGAGYTFKPEPILDGGILMDTWPGKTNVEHYKTLRLGLRGSEWPWITNNTLNEWRERRHNPIVLKRGRDRSAKVCLYTFLKAFHGAPIWTSDEMQRVVDVFARNGLRVIRKSVPSQKRMRMTNRWPGR